MILSIIFCLESCSKKRDTKSKKTDHTWEVKRLTAIADRQYEEDKLDSAFHNYNKIILLADIKNNTVDYADALIAMGYIHHAQGDYINSEAVTTKILPLLAHLKKTRFAWNAYNILGLNYLATKDYDNALFYLKKALALKTNPWRQLETLSNIGLIYIEQHNYKKATDLYLQITTQGYYAAKKKQHTLDAYDYTEYATMIDNLGFCLFKLKNPQALVHFNEALEIRLKVKSYEALPFSFNHLSEYYLSKKTALSNQYANMGYKAACKINSFGTKKKSLKLLIATSTANDLKKYANAYIKLIDSMSVTQKKTKNQFSLIKYNLNQSKEENLQLKIQKAAHELQLEKQKNRSIISYVIILVVTMICILTFMHLRTKNRKEKKYAVLESEIRISKKLSDELTDNMYQILDFSSNANLNHEENKIKLLNDLTTVYSKTRNISKENSSIVTNENYSIALKEMISGFKTPDLHIILNGFDAIIWNELEKSRKIILYRILQELFGNMKKHSQATLVSLTFKNFEKKIVVTYSDNGVGAYNRSIILKNGLQNVENRIKTINGNIIFDSNSKTGFKLSFNFPK
ncbi:tetratricopeptide repeat-containing sensor histidine kinase [Flavobacterium sp. N502540]|uniref:tetratricopeptide repeat-containing sensor histidine kinase n=1 Tax=Flavobacterium sp. N502540 TaxID=2986838 RepID=UPI00222576DB|nr:tetratricopeptide repeat-containing sensor histidine kinase [Flavobacterium sp. N502540]